MNMCGGNCPHLLFFRFLLILLKWKEWILMTLMSFIHEFSNRIAGDKGGVISIENLTEHFFKVCDYELTEYDIVHMITLSYHPNGANVHLSLINDDRAGCIKLSIRFRSECAVIITLIEMGLYKTAFHVLNHNRRIRWDNIIEDIIIYSDLAQLEKYLYIAKYIPEVVTLSRRPLILSKEKVEDIMDFADYMIHKSTLYIFSSDEDTGVWIMKKNMIMKYASDLNIMTYKEDMSL